MRFSRTRFVLIAQLLTTIACSGSTPTSPRPSSEPQPVPPPVGVAHTLYVSPTGNDQNDGTIGAPWGSLRYAVAQLHAGDTLYLRGGTYGGDSDNVIDTLRGTIRGGTSWANPITIGGYPSEVAVLKPWNTLTPISLTSSTQQYLIFQDLVIDMSFQVTDNSQPGIYVAGGANHDRFQRIEIKNNVNFGISFSKNNGNAPFNEVINCSIHDNGAIGGLLTNGHGLYIATSDNLIEGNEVYNNKGYGIQLYSNSGDPSVTRNVVRGNKIHDNGRHGGTAYGVVVAWGSDNLIHNNVIYGNPGGVLVYTNSSNAEVSDNSIYNNTPLEGIRIEHAIGTLVKDNTLYGNGTDIVDLGIGTILSNNHRNN